MTDKQVEICDICLKENARGHLNDYLYEKGYEHFDLQVSSRYLLDNKLISFFNPVMITDLGTKYIEKGIVEFIKHKRIDDFLNSTIFKTVAIWIPIFISLVFNVSNCSRTNHVENESVLNKKQYRDIDSTIKEIVKKLDKQTIKESTIDTTKIFDNRINEKPK